MILPATSPEQVIALTQSEHAARLNQPYPLPATKPHRHRWGDRSVISPNKTERECLNGCGIVKVSRHESEGGRDIYWPEFWRGLDRIDHGGKTPACEPESTDA